MKVWQISYSDISGGAARAAFRIHHALITAGIDSTMHVTRASSGDATVILPTGSISKSLSLIRPRLGSLSCRLFKTGNPIIHSPSIIPSSWPRRINESDADIAHLHWVCGEMMSVEDIGRIKKPLVWTLHDMWAFCGAEHYTTDERFCRGYIQANRPDHESGFDLNRWTWNRKCRSWRRPIHIVTPSQWLAACTKRSYLMGDWQITVVHNPLDTDIWRPIQKKTARILLNLPDDCRLLAFGAMGGGKDPRKGMNLLLAALNGLRDQIPGLELIVFGEQRPPEVPDVGFPIHYTGHLFDDLSLRVLYSAADSLVIPSRQDNLPNTGVESLACGTPIVAFNTCGLTDIVVHKQTGWLAEPFDTEDLAKGIKWVLDDEERLARLGKNARKYAEEYFAASVVAKQYKKIYQKLLLQTKNL